MSVGVSREKRELNGEYCTTIADSKEALAFEDIEKLLKTFELHRKIEEIDRK